MRKLLQMSALLGILVSSAVAQFDTATVLGTIKDPSGSAVVSGSVKLESLDTGVVASATTDASGNYQFFNVRIGRYRVSAEHPGFKEAVSDAFSVTVSARQRVDLALEIGQVSERITVNAAAALLETDSSSRGSVIGYKQIVDLPLNGRSYADLTLLTPGTVPALRGTIEGRNASYHVNGLRSTYNNFTLDGVENNAYGTSNQGFSNQVVQVTPDAVGEFRVTTNNFSAEYGRAGGAVITASLRGGTNSLHLTVWEFLRNTDLNAVGFFKPQLGKPILIQNQFGAAAGGPVIRNKTFWFADYEGFRRTQKGLRYATMPTMDQRQGILGTAVVDPYSGSPWPNNTVPQSAITPFARKVLGDLPAPNRPGTDSLGIANNYESLLADTIADNKGDFKVDHYFNQRITSFFRYSHHEMNQITPWSIPGPSGGGDNGTVRTLNKAIAGGLTYTVTPTSLIEFRLAFTKTEGGKFPTNFSEPHIEETYGIKGIAKDPRIGGGLNSQQVGGFTSWGRQTSNPQYQNPDVWNPRVNYSTLRGKHSLKFGSEFQSIQTDINDLAPMYGLSSYAGKFTSPTPGSGSNLYNLADFLVGAQSTLDKTAFGILDYRQRMYFFYLQDDFKVSSRLTLNMGVRYEYATPQWEGQNHLGNYDPKTNSLIFAKDGSIYDRALRDPDRNNWAPRLGLAFSLPPKTVVRAGYGISYVHFNRMGGENLLGFTGPFVVRVTRNQVPPGVPRGGQPVCTPGQDWKTCFVRTQDGFPADFNDPRNFSTLVSRVNYIPRDTATGYVQSWHFTIQRELARDIVFDIGYVGNRGVKQWILTDYNQSRPNNVGDNLTIDQRRPISGFVEIQATLSAGNSFYHGLQTKLEKRFSQGVYVLNSFTWSKAIDNAPGHQETFNGDTSRMNYYNLKGERGLSSYDVPLNNVTSIIWDVPYGKGRRWGSSLQPVLNAVLGGWRTTLINGMRSGNAVNIYYNPSAQFKACTVCNQRPNLIGPFQSPTKDIKKFFISENVVIPTDPRFPFGNAGRNIGRTHSFLQADLGFYKDFQLPREGARIEFRSEFFNLTNRTNFQAADSRRDSSGFGTVNSSFPARQIQLALKLYF